MHYETPVPFGQDRLIPIWVATLAVRQKNRTVRFGSAAQILDFFHLPKDGPHYRRMVAGFKRVFAATIFFGTDQQTSATTVIDLARFHFFDPCLSGWLPKRWSDVKFPAWTPVVFRRRSRNFSEYSPMMRPAQDTLSTCGGRTGLRA